MYWILPSIRTADDPKLDRNFELQMDVMYLI